MKSTLGLQQIIDLEYYFHQDKELTREDIQQRDRNIGLQIMEETKEQPDDKELLNTWLSARNSEEFGAPDLRTPGNIFNDTLKLSTTLVIILGLFAGVGSGLGFFIYTGQTPVNVFTFLLLFVASQIILSLTLLLYLPFKNRNRQGRSPLPPYYSALFTTLINRMGRYVQKHWKDSFSAGKRDSIRYAFGVLFSRNRLYGSLLFWPIFTLSQLFGLCANLGLLTFTLLKVMSSDLAFGWQSTIQFSDQAIYKFVQLISFPWAWLPFSGTTPGLAQIAGSRIILKDGIYHLATSDLTAWWPFLLLSLFCYGLLVRLVLLLFGKYQTGRAEHKFSPQSPEMVSLLGRMKTPLVTTQAKPEEKSETDRAFPKDSPPPTVPITPTISAIPQHLFICDDVFENCEEEALNNYLKEHNFSIASKHRYQTGYDEDQALLDQLPTKTAENREGIFFLMEGWMVPLVAFISYIKQVRERIPENMIITIGLLGKPGKTIYTPASHEEIHIWQQKIGAIGDPLLQLLPLVDTIPDK